MEQPLRGPLAGIRVLEIGGIGPGPMAAMVLADLGAEVLRIDKPRDDLVFTAPEHNLLHRGRRSAIVDLRQSGGPEVVRRLARTADVVTEGYRPGVAERLGIGPDDLFALNPRLIYGRMTGWGQDGPIAHTAGHDIAYIAVTGTLHAIGRAGGPPQVPVNLLGDFAAGSMFLVTGVLAALLEARVSGRGQVVDAAIVDGSAVLSTMVHGLLAGGVWRDERGVNPLDTGAPFYDVYETADGRHMAVGALESQFYDEFVRLLDPGPDLPNLPDRFDVAAWPQLRERFAATFRTRTMAEWSAIFEGSDACVAPVVSLTEAPHHPQLAARETFATAHGVVQPAPAPRFSRTPAALSTPPARPGEHSRAALSDWGIDDVDTLIADGVVIQR
jgi:alpha-methylacyl-CoA racemase